MTALAAQARARIRAKTFILCVWKTTRKRNFCGSCWTDWGKTWSWMISVGLLSRFYTRSGSWLIDIQAHNTLLILHLLSIRWSIHIPNVRFAVTGWVITWLIADHLRYVHLIKETIVSICLVCYPACAGKHLDVIKIMSCWRMLNIKLELHYWLIRIETFKVVKAKYSKHSWLLIAARVLV